MHTNVYLIYLTGILVTGLVTSSSVVPPSLLRKLAAQTSTNSQRSSDENNSYDLESQTQYEGYPTRFKHFADLVDFVVRIQQNVQKRRFAVGMPNLIRVGMLQKRQLENLHLDKRRIGLSMPSILHMHGVEKHPFLIEEP